MRSSSMTAIAEGPAAPLSPRMRAELRADRPPTPVPFVRSESGRRLARALDRFARGDRDREAWLVHGPAGSGRTTVVMRAVEQAMAALTWLARPVQLLPVTVRTASLWADGDDRFDEVRVIARFVAIATIEELIERLSVRVGDDTERNAAVQGLWQMLRGMPERDELRGLRSKAEPRITLFGDEDDEEDERVGLEAEVLWQSARLRGVRKPEPPAPPPSAQVLDPALVDALRGEVRRLSRALAERDEAIARHLETLGTGQDPYAVVLSAIATAALGVSIYGVTGGVFGGVFGAGLGYVLGRNGKAPTSLVELDEVPEVTPRSPRIEVKPPPQDPEEESFPEDPDSPQDADALADLLTRFVRDLRAVGYAPIFILDELERAEGERARVEARMRRFLSDMPPGCCAILVADSADFAADVPEIKERLPVVYRPASLHAYLDRRLPMQPDLSETAAAEAEIDRAIWRYALLHASRMRPDAIDQMLLERRIGAVRFDTQAARSAFPLRLRAAQQIALEQVLDERSNRRSAHPDLVRLLTAALQLVFELWEQGRDPDVRPQMLEAHLSQAATSVLWARATAGEREQVNTAVKSLLGLLSSRAGLVARLPAHLAPLADLIPDAPLVVREGTRWHWTFDVDGRPTDVGMAQQGEAPASSTDAGLLRPARPQTRASDPGRFRALDSGFEAPRRIKAGDPLPITGEYRAIDASRLNPDGSMDGDDRTGDSMSGGRRRWGLIDASEAVRFLEAVDEALGTIGDGALSVGRLASVGLVPTIPTQAAIARALTEGDSPSARIVLDEAVGRLRERLGVIEKFALWLTAARALSPEKIGTMQIASALVKARALRGRSAPAQHAHLMSRTLQAELRALCPRVRLRGSIFRRSATPGTDPEGIARWGEGLSKRAEELAALLADGASRSTLTTVAWRALRNRLRQLVIEGEAGLPAFAEAIAALTGAAGAKVTDWLSPTPTARNLSALLLASRDHSAPEQLGDGGLYAALALGLNRNGMEAVGLELPERETSEAGDLIRDAGKARAPVALVLTNDPDKGLAAGPPPQSSRGSALVLTPEEVITSTKKLGFEVIFLDDPTIDAGMLPLPPAPVLAPPLADDIDAALGWWTTHR